MPSERPPSRHQVEATRAFHEWRLRERDRLVERGCSKAFADQFMAPWFTESVASWIDQKWGARVGDNDQ